MKKNKLLSIIPAFWVASFDIIITIVHQSNEYWQGNLKEANEANPIGAFFMANSIYGIFIISFIWLILIVLLGYYLPAKISRIFLLFVLFVHVCGASSWITYFYSFWFFILFHIFNAILYFKIEEITQNKESNKL